MSYQGKLIVKGILQFLVKDTVIYLHHVCRQSIKKWELYIVAVYKQLFNFIL